MAQARIAAQAHGQHGALLSPADPIVSMLRKSTSAASCYVPMNRLHVAILEAHVFLGETTSQHVSMS
jgi:hypothetical protein